MSPPTGLITLPVAQAPDKFKYPRFGQLANTAMEPVVRVRKPISKTFNFVHCLNAEISPVRRTRPSAVSVPYHVNLGFIAYAVLGVLLTA